MNGIRARCPAASSGAPADTTWQNGTTVSGEMKVVLESLRAAPVASYLDDEFCSRIAGLFESFEVRRA